MHEVVDAKNTECLQKKIADCECSQPKREVIYPETSTAIAVRLSKASGACVSPPCVLEEGYIATGHNIFLVGFQFYFGLILFFPTFPPFWNRNTYFVPLHVRIAQMNFAV